MANTAKRTQELAVVPKNVERPSWEMELAALLVSNSQPRGGTGRTGSPWRRSCRFVRSSLPYLLFRPCARAPAAALSVIIPLRGAGEVRRRTENEIPRGHLQVVGHGWPAG